MNQSFISFKDQVCLVTGAGSATGIGFAAAKILGSLGGRIAITATTDRICEREAELKAEGIEAKAYIADLMDREQVKALADQVAADFGAIHVLVNNAGMVQTGQGEEDMTPVKDMTYENWDTYG